MDAQKIGAASRFADMANLFAIEIPLSAYQDNRPDDGISEPQPYIPEEDRISIQQITGGAGEVMNRTIDKLPQDIDEAAYPFLLALMPFAQRYFPGQVTH